MAQLTQSLSAQTAASIAGLLFLVLYFSSAMGVQPPNFDVPAILHQLFGALLALLVAPRIGGDASK